MASDNATFEQQVLELTNQERVKSGLAPLKANAELNYAADEYAELMSQNRYFSHTGPDGSKPWDRAASVGFEAQTMGENIAAGQKTPQDVVQAWMNSPGHRANILRPSFTQLGVGFDNNYWVQDFGSDDRNPASNIPGATSNSESQPEQPVPQPTPNPTQSAPTGNTTPTNSEANNGAFEQQVLELTNQERVKSGLAPLKANAELNYAADEYAELMSQNRYFSHTGPDGSKPWDRAASVGFEAQTMGENIAAGQKTPQDVVQAWMNSPGHRANILNPSFTQLGVGFDNNYWVQDFGSDDRNPASNIPQASANTVKGVVKDTTVATEDDILTGSKGNARPLDSFGQDKLFASAGRDQFINRNMQDKGDTIANFKPNEDTLDLRGIVTGSSGRSSNKFSDYLQPDQVGADTVLRLDADGKGNKSGLDKLLVLDKVDASRFSANNCIV
ncbi:SCP-like extracellular [Calothrix sp. NIES-4071]|nr:SCP-like extracellular [Calothrix sp. NIES-4071]BAZ60181.1 SCP-like extracellular [Calothrix sp. NIES-4105]